PPGLAASLARVAGQRAPANRRIDTHFLRNHRFRNPRGARWDGGEHQIRAGTAFIAPFSDTWNERFLWGRFNEICANPAGNIIYFNLKPNRVVAYLGDWAA